jgi:hypothetical protein
MIIIHDSFIQLVFVLGSWSNGWAFIDAQTGLWPIAGVVMLLAYYAVVYRAFLTPPPQRSITPRYEPPDNTSPAMLRFLERKTFDEKAFAATVLDLASRGYMEIRGGQTEPYTFCRTKNNVSSLSADEKVLADALFHDGTVLRIDLVHRAMIERTKKLMANCVEIVAARYFTPSTLYVIVGVALTIAVLLALAMRSASIGAVLLICVLLAMFGSIMTVAWVSVVRTIRQSLQRRSALGILMAITASAGIAPASILLCACVLLMVLLAHETSIAFALCLLAVVVINVVFHYVLHVPTPEGRRLLDEAAGFRLFLATVEADQLNRVSDGTTAPEVISKVLPYAVALDLEHRWASQRFAHAFGYAGGEYVSSKHVETGTVLPQGIKLPNPFDLLSLAGFLMEVAPQINAALAQAYGEGKSPYANMQEVLQALATRSARSQPQTTKKSGIGR